MKLLKEKKIYSTFHVALLDKAQSKIFLQTHWSIKSKDQTECEVEKIMNRKLEYYLIKWKEYSTKENTWKSLENLHNVKKAIQQYHYLRGENVT